MIYIRVPRFFMFLTLSPLAKMSCAIIYFNLWLPLLLLSLLLVAFLLIMNMKKKSTKNPPSPPKLPIIGNLHQLGNLPHQSLYELSKKYGPAMLLQLGSIPTLIVSSASVAKEILKTHDISFCSRPPSPGPKRILYNSSDVAFQPYGDQWRNTRKIFVFHLLSLKRAQSFSKVREVKTSALIKCLRETSPNPVNLDEKIFDLVGAVIGLVAFGKSCTGKQFEGLGLKDVMRETMNMIDSFSGEDFFPFFGKIVDFLTGHQARLEKCHRLLDGLLELVLDEHLRQDTRKCEDEDMVDALLRNNDEITSIPLSKEQIKAILMNTFLGGIDTTAITILWAMSELMRNPRVMQKVQSEIRGTLGTKPKVESNDLNKFSYLKVIVKETLRLHPSAPLLLPRETMGQCKIRGEKGETYDIYPKTRVLINAWAIGRDPNSWKNPHEFYPERFEGNDIDFKGEHFEFVPFGGGRRICPGISNSIATIEFTLANLLYWFNWEVPNGKKVEEAVSMEEEGGVCVHQKAHLTLIPIKHVFN